MDDCKIFCILCGFFDGEEFDEEMFFVYLVMLCVFGVFLDFDVII